MKKMLLIAFLLIAVKGFAQISLKETFNPGANIIQVSSTEWDFYTFAGSNPYGPDTANVYSNDHSFIETIIMPCPANSSNIGMEYLSKNLFTTGGEYDYIHLYKDTFLYVYPNLSYFWNTINIVEDNGTSLLTVDSVEGIDGIFNTPDGTELVLNKALPNGNAETLVYSLPGSDAGIPRPQTDIMVNNAYPNPSDNMIHLPYNLNGNAQGELDVVNMQGQLLKQFKIGSTFNDILLNTGDLPKGSYLYYVTTNGQQSQAKQFVVQ